MIILNNLYSITSIFVILRGFIIFTRHRKHLLNTLLRLEFIILGIFFCIIGCICFLGYERYFVLFFLTLAACEGALGLSLLVSIVCFHGNDCFRSFRSLGC